jgi:hypothetical protein
MHLFKAILIFALLFISKYSSAQELYTATEPASNRAAKSVGFRVDNSIMDERGTSRINYHLIPELMIGVHSKLTMHAGVFFSNRSDRFQYEGATLYGKYRFLNRDAMQRHFRMAAFGRISVNNSDIHQEEINMYGHNTGYEAGIVATQLLRKVAISSSVSYLKATDNRNNNKFPYGSKQSNAINYTLSFGKLMLPREYKDYRQTNVNLMVEFLNQLNIGSSKFYMDIAPSIQFIFNSQSRVDIGYRKELSSTMLRTAPNGFFVRLEHNFFNAF